MKYSCSIIVLIAVFSLQAANFTLEKICMNKLTSQEPEWQEPYQKALATLPIAQAQELAYAKHSISTMVKIRNSEDFAKSTSSKAKESKDKRDGIEIKRLQQFSCNLITGGPNGSEWRFYIDDNNYMRMQRVALLDITADAHKVYIAHASSYSLCIKLESFKKNNVSVDIESGELSPFLALPVNNYSYSNSVSGIAFHPHLSHLLFSSTHLGTAIHMHDVDQYGTIVKSIPLNPATLICGMQAFSFNEYIPSSLVLVDSEHTLSFIPLNRYKKEGNIELKNRETGFAFANQKKESCIIMQHPTAKNNVMIIKDELYPITLDSQPLQDDLAFINKRVVNARIKKEVVEYYRSFLKIYIAQSVYKKCISF